MSDENIFPSDLNMVEIEIEDTPICDNIVDYQIEECKTNNSEVNNGMGVN